MTSSPASGGRAPLSWIIGLLFAAGGQVSELVLIFAFLIMLFPILHLLASPEAVLGLVIQIPETTRGSTEELTVSEKPQNNSAMTVDAAAPTPPRW